jgi:hypothetical protein
MSREKLLDIASKLLGWVNAHSSDPAELKSIVADDLVVTIPIPGQTPDLAGFLGYQKMACKASSDFKLTLLKAVADEVECTVVHFLEISGTHEGYLSI